MIDTNAFSNLKKSIDNMAKAFEPISVPRYMWMEILHPKKKPRGSIRRKRKGSDSK
jgi:hypothetical protein